MQADDCGACEPSGRTLFRAQIPSIPGTWEPYIHGPCPCNELAALRKRVLCPFLDASPDGQVELRRVVSSFASSLLRSGLVEPWDIGRTVQSYRGRLRRRYEVAAESLQQELCSPVDARISAFVKAEKFNPRLKVPAPRIIQGRSPRYNLELATWLKPIEHRVYGLKGFRWFGVPRTRLVAKGLNQKQRATLISRKMGAIPGCAVIGLDMSAFDAHVASWQLVIEGGFYNKLSPSSRLRTLLSWQLRNRGKTSTGIKYSRTGGRASGDFNTGMGNSILMSAMCVGFLESLFRGGASGLVDCLVDGDDALLFVSPELVSAVMFNCRGFMHDRYGHEAKVEEPVYHLGLVTFGQCRPIRVHDGLTMVRNPHKVLSGMFASHRHWQFPKGGKRVAKVVALCELALNGGVPVLQPWALAALDALSGVRLATRAEPDDYMEYLVSLSTNLANVKARPITLSARAEFEFSWGVSVEEQIRLESGFVLSFPDSFPPREEVEVILGLEGAGDRPDWFWDEVIG